MESIASKVIGEECTKVMLTQGNFFDKHCLQLLISTLLGYGIILGSTMFKIPQILKIWSQKSAKGVALSTYFMENVVLTVSLGASLAHNAHFSTYGESFFILIQNTVIILEIVHYNKVPALHVFALAVGFALYFGFMVSGFVPEHIWDILQVANTGVMIVSRLPQIVGNIRDKNVEQQSIITWGLNFLGGVARIFTTWKQRSDEVFLLWSFVIAASLNGIITLQILMYSKPSSKKGKRD